MRISTSQIFDSGARGIGRNQFELFKLQNQMSTGRKVLTPEDDPIAAAQALVLTQTKEVSSQFLKNQGDAQGKLGVVDNQLTAVSNLLQNVRERIVQAGNTTLSNSDRSFIAQELEARFSELLGIANGQDGSGNYLFSGYQGTVKPFSVNAAGAQYLGDSGKRLLQVDGSRQLATNVSGKELFEAIRSGNGTFVTSTNGNSGGGINQGTAVIDQGSVSNLSAWNSTLADPTLWTSLSATPPVSPEIEIRFTDVLGVMNYELFEVGVATPISGPNPYVSGQSIDLKNGAVSLGGAVVIEGQPVVGDSFRVKPSTNESVFTTLRSTIDAIGGGVGSVAGGNSSTEFVNALAGRLQQIDQALDNVNKTQSTVGSNLKELDSLGNSGEDMQLQYAASLSALQDLDYTKAITDMAKKQMQLEAAQLSFKQTSQLSLFSIL